MERIYAVEFNTYTNCMRDTVSDGNKSIGEAKYISLPKDVPFLIRESELLEYVKYGNGYKSVFCVGAIKKD